VRPPDTEAADPLGSRATPGMDVPLRGVQTVMQVDPPVRYRRERLAELSLAAVGCALSIAPLVLAAAAGQRLPSPVPPPPIWPLPGFVFAEAAASGLLGLTAATRRDRGGVQGSLLSWATAGILLSLAVPTFASIGLLLGPAALALTGAAWIGTRARGPAVSSGMTTLLVAGAANFVILVALVLTTRWAGRP